MLVGTPEHQPIRPEYCLFVVFSFMITLSARLHLAFLPTGRFFVCQYIVFYFCCNVLLSVRLGGMGWQALL